MSVTHAATEGHVWVYSPAATGVCVAVHDPCYHRKPYECLRSVLKPEVMLMSVGCAADGVTLMGVAHTTT